MADRTGISWTDRTQNFWTGCMRVSPGCDFCYAAALAKRAPVTFGSWEPGASRKRTGTDNWRKPSAWDRKAAKTGETVRVFCSSMADFFDNAVPAEWRAEAWAVIRITPHLTWQILTKRPQNIARMLPPDWGDGWSNVWLGTTVENQTEADRRIPVLLAVPARVRFISAEPLLGRVNLAPFATPETDLIAGGLGFMLRHRLPGISWCIVGGESGSGARPMRREWAEHLLDQCEAMGVAAFFKQVGSNRGSDWPAGITGKGDDPTQWPEAFHVQQFPGMLMPRRDGAGTAELFAEATP